MGSPSKWYDCAHCDAGYLEQACTCRNAADFDGDGYPTEATIKRIITWPYTDMQGLVEYVRSLWYWPVYARRRGRRYSFSTGGWSGNESLIYALEKNFLFWSLCWESSRRGGHYEFELPEIKDAKRKDVKAENRSARSHKKRLGRKHSRRAR